MSPSPHRRYNPLLDEWVLCSPHRLERPWQGDSTPPADGVAPAYDATCYLCPGNRRAHGERNPAYDSTFAFDNDFPALLNATGPVADAHPLLRAQPATGICRVVCFSPRHDLTIARMSPAQIRPVIDTWAEEVETIGSRPDIAYVQVFENKGAIMGCSNAHPHGQLWATAHVPTGPARRGDTQRRHFETCGEDLLGAYLRVEVERGERVVLANEHWVVVVPFWAVWPYETMVIPRRRVPDLPSLHADERNALADVISRLNVRYDNLFHTPFPYSMGWHARPTDGGEHPWWRLHAVYAPPLLRSASVRKFLVGYEMAAEPQRDLTAEQAADRLRTRPERHYLDSRTLD